MGKRKIAAEEIPLSDLKDDPNNANLGTEEGQGIIERSMEEFGFVAPGLVNVLPDGTRRVIAGNKRKAAAAKLGHEDALIIPWGGEKPIYLETNLPESEATKLAYLLNLAPKINIKWDRSQIQTDAAGLDLKDVGFSGQELVRLGVKPEEAQDEESEIGITDSDIEESTDRESEDAAAFTVSQGDIWLLSENPATYAICASCLELPSKLPSFLPLSEGSVTGIVTSPPYAMQRSSHYGGIEESSYSEWFGEVSKTLAHFLSPVGNFFLNIKPHSTKFIRSDYVFALVLSLIRDHDWLFIDEYSWQHGGIPGSPHKMGKFKNQFEPIYHFARTLDYQFFPENVVSPTTDAVLDSDWEYGVGQDQQGRQTTFANRDIGDGLAYPGNVLHLKQRELTGHEATFPTGLPRFFMQAFERNSQDPKLRTSSAPLSAAPLWLDPFLGSGTTCIAAHKLGIPSIGIELHARYVAMFLSRFKRITDIEPQKIGTLS